MIKNITAKGFKGLDFDQPLSKKTIICGPNGSGKSSRTMAISLALLGYVPGSEKTNPAILSAFGKDKLQVGARVNGSRFDRVWKKSPKGSVNQTYLVDTRKSGKDAFISALAQAGNPKIFDLSIFMDLSDQKKIDYLFNLFPPAGDVSELDDDISHLSEKLNKKRQDIRVSEAFVSKTMENRSNLDVPSGTLAETNGELEKVKKQLSDAWESLNKAEIAKAEAEQKAKSEKEAKERAERAEREAKEQAESDRARQESESRVNQTAGYQKAVRSEETGPAIASPTITPEQFPEFSPKVGNGAADSIKKIISAIKSVDCAICKNGAAMMVAKNELRKHS